MIKSNIFNKLYSEKKITEMKLKKIFPYSLFANRFPLFSHK